ncbi:oxidoreductase [Paenibacillus sp. PsM32]|uniref:oxidoreductase n=1 Tax=Paenibacillus sp. PsM32 TaxID=3030536 RepID=UPI00263AFA7D|nr:oxidoreductase [Paenibacillus sp. PsM32]MDN4618183.1 oxidoreductase [Paenibacillus sp. PsM32]
MNDIQLKRTTRIGFSDSYVDGEIKKCEYNTDFYDIIIDGNSLYSTFENYDYISVLGQINEDLQKNEIKKLLLESPSELRAGQYFIFVCPMCADLGCGAITVSIKREEEYIIWADFRSENHETSQSLNMGPYKFLWKDYLRIISSADL